MVNSQPYQLELVHLGINSQQEAIVFVHFDSDICRSEGFGPHVRIKITLNKQSMIATINVVKSDILNRYQAGLSEIAWKRLQAKPGDLITLSHIEPVTSLKYVRAKIYNNPIPLNGFNAIIQDIVKGNYSSIQISSFVTACAGNNLNLNEITDLTKAMIQSGEQLKWHYPFVAGKHSVGGLPGNRTTPIVVAIVAAAGVIIPKTSSRAITSPAGTADTMSTMTRVDLDIPQLRNVVEKEGGCFAWGGAINLSPADDIIIHVERVLDLDPEGQMIASVLSKTFAAGATDIVLDIPVGQSAKVRSDEMFLKLHDYFMAVTQAIGINAYILKSDGNQPVGCGIGPCLEAREVLNTLNNQKEASADLRAKAIFLAGKLLEFAKKAPPDQGAALAKTLLENGSALKKFLAICEAQGGFREPTLSKFTYDITASQSGIVTNIDNRNLAMIAKLAGAPHDPAAGLEFFAKLGTKIERGATLFRIHAEYKGELDYALNYANSCSQIITLDGNE